MVDVSFRGGELDCRVAAECDYTSVGVSVRMVKVINGEGEKEMLMRVGGATMKAAAVESSTSAIGEGFLEETEAWFVVSGRLKLSIRTRRDELLDLCCPRGTRITIPAGLYHAVDPAHLAAYTRFSKADKLTKTIPRSSQAEAHAVRIGFKKQYPDFGKDVDFSGGGAESEEEPKAKRQVGVRVMRKGAVVGVRELANTGVRCYFFRPDPREVASAHRLQEISQIAKSDPYRSLLTHCLKIGLRYHRLHTFSGEQPAIHRSQGPPQAAEGLYVQVGSLEVSLLAEDLTFHLEQGHLLVIPPHVSYTTTVQPHTSTSSPSCIVAKFYSAPPFLAPQKALFLGIFALRFVSSLLWPSMGETE